MIKVLPCKNCKYFTKVKLVLLLFLVFPELLCGQYFFDFETDSLKPDSECPADSWEQFPAGRWNCSSEQPLSGKRSLRHAYDNQGSGCDHIILTHDPPVTDSTFGCSFRIRHGYPPSSANNWQVALLSETSLEDPEWEETDGTEQFVQAPEGDGSARTGTGGEWISEGLILGVNLVGSDDRLTLWQWEEGTPRVICVTSLNYQDVAGTGGAPLISLEVGRDRSVSIYFARDPGSAISLIGTGQLNSVPAGRQLVFRFRYSSAQDRKLWIDDLVLSGTFIKDTLPPVIDSVEVVDGVQVIFYFSEPIKQTGCSAFRLERPGGVWQQPVACRMEGEGQVWIEFAEELPNRESVRIGVADVCDPDGNCLSDTTLTLRRCEAVWGDLVFNEVLADPAPQVRLPDLEFLELYNRSGEQFDLSGWQLAVNGRIYLLDEDNTEPGLRIAPGGYLLVTGMNLPNEGGELVLLTENGILVHAAAYAIPWQGPEWKKEGGWSLESPDPERICGISSLWGYSEDASGGTPARINSLDARLEDTKPPELLFTGFRYNQAVFSIYFSEPVRSGTWMPSHFPISPGSIFPEWVEPSFPLSDRIDLGLPEGLSVEGTFRVGIPYLVDCSGNMARARNAHGGFPRPPVYGNVVVSEVMFAPEEGAPEYIELCHTGHFYCDLKDLAVSVTKEGEESQHLVPVSSFSRLMAPGSFLVLTKHADQLMDAYNLDLSGKWVEMKPWKALENEGGIITLTDRSGQVVDRVPFGNRMHMELLGDTRGISLERIDLLQPGDHEDNWHSAASIAGYATPGEPNSQRADGVPRDEILEVSPKVFSPDNDGREDLLEVTITPQGHGWVVHLMITDLEGRKIRTLANNDLAGATSVYRWDGESDHHQMVPEGIYLLHAWGYHNGSGKKWKQRLAVGVIYR